MPAHERHVDRAERAARRALAELGREIRLARLNHDLSQRAAAETAGISQPTWSRLEAGTLSRVSVIDLAVALAVVGRDLSVRAYPGGSPVRDQAHLDLLAKLRRLLGHAVHWATEVPFPNAGDRRSWDALARVSRVRIGIEAETRAQDVQELKRRLEGKRKDGGVDHLILLLRDTRHNRAFLRTAGEDFAAAFPVPGPVALRRLAASQDPGGSSIILL